MEDPITPRQRGAHPQQGRTRLSGPPPVGDREPGEVSGAQSYLHDGVSCSPKPPQPPAGPQVLLPQELPLRPGREA